MATSTQIGESELIPVADETEDEQRSGVDTDRFSLVVAVAVVGVVVDVDVGVGVVNVGSSSFDVSWSSLECPLSLLVSLSLSESSSDFLSDSFSLSDSSDFSSSGLSDGEAVAASFCPPCKTCCPKEKMETRLVIWSISMAFWCSPRNAG